MTSELTPEQIEQGLALIEELREVLNKIHRSGICEDFEINTEIGAIENCVRIVKEILE